jgi:hypothetical protein
MAEEFDSDELLEHIFERVGEFELESIELKTSLYKLVAWAS